MQGVRGGRRCLGHAGGEGREEMSGTCREGGEGGDV